MYEADGRMQNKDLLVEVMSSTQRIKKISMGLSNNNKIDDLIQPEFGKLPAFKVLV